jgi:hypothetical protein
VDTKRDMRTAIRIAYCIAARLRDLIATRQLSSQKPYRSR